MADPSRIQEEMDRFQGIDGGEALYLRLGRRKIFGRFENGRSNEKKLSAVHYVRFPLLLPVPSRDSVSEVRRLLHHGEVELCLSHPAYQASAVLNPVLKEELLRDLD